MPDCFYLLRAGIKDDESFFSNNMMPTAFRAWTNHLAYLQFEQRSIEFDFGVGDVGGGEDFQLLKEKKNGVYLIEVPICHWNRVIVPVQQMLP